MQPKTKDKLDPRLADSNKVKVTSREAMAKIDGAYSRCFKTRDGKVVLDHLCEAFYDGVMDGPDLSRLLGRRDVVRAIQQRLKRYAA